MEYRGWTRMSTKEQLAEAEKISIQDTVNLERWTMLKR